MKKILFLLAAVVLIPACNSGSQTNSNANDEQIKTLNTDLSVPGNDSAMTKYNSAYSAWVKSRIENYYLKVKYGAFSPVQGIWEIEVLNGSVSAWRFNGKENAEEYRSFADRMTIESLFELAKQSFLNKEDGMFLFYANYNQAGYVMAVGKIVNPGALRPVPTDQTFRYEVLEFREIN